MESGSSDSDMDLDRLGVEMDLRKVCRMTEPDRMKNVNDQHARLDDINYDNNLDCSVPHQGCTHCELKKHDDRGCWKRLTCQKCVRKGHLDFKYFCACAACRNVHECGKCPMEVL